jgi:uncharacterized protein YdiU (UPF0061 family)
MTFTNTYHQLPARFYEETDAASFDGPTLLKFNQALANDLGLDSLPQDEGQRARIFSGQTTLEGSQPIALAYAGHQFGHFVPQLGDGRALLLGEVTDAGGKRFDIQLKGSGRTAFSRNGDGYSAMGPVIREYLVSEAMHHLGIPTTRALAAVATGNHVQREAEFPGAVFTRVASSHLRVGSFQYFAARDDLDGVETLLNYAIDRHYPQIRTDTPDANGALEFLKKVIQAQAELVSQWMSVGFIHGVMNTDNCSVSGETIDFGPCAFMDAFSYNKVFSSIDHHGRYAYINQGPIAQWNLTRLAECLAQLVDPDIDKAHDLLQEALLKFEGIFNTLLTRAMTTKLGLNAVEEGDQDLVKLWLTYLDEETLDFTISFRKLADCLESENGVFKPTDAFKAFDAQWRTRLKAQGREFSEAKQTMNAVNPLYIPRNHLVEQAIQLAMRDDLSVFNEMNQLLRTPFEHQPGLDRYQAAPNAGEEITQTFCGT